jgi:hypothetical protein
MESDIISANQKIDRKEVGGFFAHHVLAAIPVQEESVRIESILTTDEIVWE